MSQKTPLYANLQSINQKTAQTTHPEAKGCILLALGTLEPLQKFSCDECGGVGHVRNDCGTKERIQKMVSYNTILRKLIGQLRKDEVDEGFLAELEGIGGGMV